MALKGEEIENCGVIEESDSTRINSEECQPRQSQPTANLIYSSPVIKEECLIEEDQKISDLFNEIKNVRETECNKEASIKVQESHNPTHQPEQSGEYNSTLALKDEKLSSVKEFGGYHSLGDADTEIYNKSNDESPCASKCSLYNAEMKHKTDCEELHNSSFDKGYVSPPAPSKQKLRNTKRRAGILYKRLTSSKFSNVTSKYFSHAHNNKKRWIPPRSPYALVQEDLFDNPWQLLVATIFLTKTSAKKAIPQLHKFLARYPRPEDVLEANYEDIDEYFKPIGLITTRSHIIMRFTVEYLEKNWTYPRELYGIGKYGDDSYRMFCINEWRQVSPDDIPLTMYRNWLLENAEHLGVE